MIGDEVRSIDHERIVFPPSNRFAIETAYGDIRIRMRAAVHVDDAEAVHEFADHVDHCGQLNHGDRPNARHNDWQSGWPALADVVPVYFSFRLGLSRRIIVNLGFGRELETRGRREPEAVI